MDEKKMIENVEQDIFSADERPEDDPMDIIRNGISFGETVESVQRVENKSMEKENPPKQNPTVPTHKPIKIGEDVQRDINQEDTSVVQKMADSFKEANSNLVKKKIENIQIGHLVTAIYGDFSNQKVINGKVVSVIDKGITILSIDKEMVDPVVVPFDTIIDIFEVKKFKKKKNDISMFKINKAIREFFSGNEEELKHAYEQKISVKKLRQELKRKENEKNKD